MALALPATCVLSDAANRSLKKRVARRNSHSDPRSSQPSVPAALETETESDNFSKTTGMSPKAPATAASPHSQGGLMLDVPGESQGSELLQESSDQPPAYGAGLEVSGADEYVGPVARPRAAKRFEFIARYCSTILL